MIYIFIWGTQNWKKVAQFCRRWTCVRLFPDGLLSVSGCCRCPGAVSVRVLSVSGCCRCPGSRIPLIFTVLHLDASPQNTDACSIIAFRSVLGNFRNICAVAVMSFPVLYSSLQTCIRGTVTNLPWFCWTKMPKRLAQNNHVSPGQVKNTSCRFCNLCSNWYVSNTETHHLV